VSNYSLDDVLKKMSIEKDKGQFAYDYHEYEYQKEYRRMEIEWKEKLDNIDIKYIEKYLRKKKLENLKKINQ
jgi:hypothetical protein